MPPIRRTFEPRTFFLNEQHELTREERSGGGGLPKLAAIDWAVKGRKISDSLRQVKYEIRRSRDPLKDRHYFLRAAPVPKIKKRSDSKHRKGLAADGSYEEEIDYSEDHSSVFRRLGLELLQVNDDGTATIHSTPERLEQLALATESLADLGQREQSRWVTIDSFGLIPPNLRIDDGWLDTVGAETLVDTIVELQPLLSRIDVDTVVRAVAAILNRACNETLSGGGTDFSGRHWLRGRMAKKSLMGIAKTFYSVQSLHAPLLSLAASPRGSERRGTSTNRPTMSPSLHTDPKSLPCVAVLDTGVPLDHRLLAQFRRGQYIATNGAGRPVGDHGSLVASRVVFGDPDFSGGASSAPTPPGDCMFYDVMVAAYAGHIYDKDVLEAMDAVTRTAPDVRVFNLSFDNHPLPALNPTDRRESLLLVQDLDNFIFANDVLTVVAAGNSPSNTPPSVPYPRHFDDPNWALGPWSCSFNALTCGSSVDRVTPHGLVTSKGWPSPFTRVGPGLCESPKPDFAAHGGNLTPTYHSAPLLGVWGCSADARWEDYSGTSYAAPLLAREAAFAIQRLTNVCEQGARPFAATIKAFLAITATSPVTDCQVAELVKRSLGRGRASARRLASPRPSSAILVWQGVLDGPSDHAKVQVPIPKDWIQKATVPSLRIVIAWDSPVNAAVRGLWACRTLDAQLRPRPDAPAITASHRTHRSYPILDRTYNLRRLPAGVSITGDMWMLGISYKQIADYYPGIDFSPQQRVAFAAELFDESEHPESPQPALQALPIAASMNRLSIPPAIVRMPVIIKTRA
jgi:hypothetical protein